MTTQVNLIRSRVEDFSKVHPSDGVANMLSQYDGIVSLSSFLGKECELCPVFIMNCIHKDSQAGFATAGHYPSKKANADIYIFRIDMTTKFFRATISTSSWFFVARSMDDGKWYIPRPSTQKTVDFQNGCNTWLNAALKQ